MVNTMKNLQKYKIDSSSLSDCVIHQKQTLSIEVKILVNFLRCGAFILLLSNNVCDTAAVVE